jgi:feruloyl esterase
MTAAMLATYPEVFAAGAIIAGLPYGTASNVQQAFESMFQGRTHTAREWGDLVRRESTHRGPWPRVSIWHGDADATVKPVNADALAEQWTNVHGVDAPPVKGKVGGYPHKVWRRDGIDVVESYTITGMAHGTPLETRAHGGEAGPFMLEAGISSSYHIAKFFGLTGDARQRIQEPAVVQARADRTPLVLDHVEIIPDDRVEVLNGKTDDSNLDDAPRAGPIDVMAVITKALTQAGLMKPPA